MTDSATQDTVRSRRAVLAAAAGGAAALAATAIRPGSVAAVAAPMLTETNNAATAPTGVTNSTDGSDALFGHATGAGTGTEGTSGWGMGVVGTSADTSNPVDHTRNAGVVGVAGSINSLAENLSPVGVYGYSDASTTEGIAGAGVWGQSPDLGVAGDGTLGVQGVGTVGVLGYGQQGVIGIAATSDGIGVHAEVDVTGARALRVAGRAEFTRSGRASVASGAKKKTVSLAGCTTSTLVMAVLASNESGRYVRAAVPAAGSFTVYFNTALTSSAVIAWIAFTNPSNHSG